MFPKNEGMIHIPVLLAEMLDALNPSKGKIIIDACFGGGGYSRSLLETGASVFAFDRDPMAIAMGQDLVQHFDGRLVLFEDCFSSMEKYVESADGIVLDIGVSSLQIDTPERGFSFRYDGPLDMRMSSSGVSAADVINHYSVSDLSSIFHFLGEERYASSIARMIERRRKEKPFMTTLDLADAVKYHLRSKAKQKIHPATRVFQALRIYVNDELREIFFALLASERILRPGGRLVVISFHSLEDRIVKAFIKDRSQINSVSRFMPPMLNKHLTFKKLHSPIYPTEAEINMNPRARSAILRVAERTEALITKDDSPDISFFHLLQWPKLFLEKS